MTMIYDLQEGARHIKAMRNNKSNNISKVLQPHLSVPEHHSKESKAKRVALKRQQDERIRKIEDNFIAKQNKLRALYLKKGYDVDGNLSPDHKFWKLKQFEDATSKVDTGSVVGHKRRSAPRDQNYQDELPRISRNQSNHVKYSEPVDLLNRDHLIPVNQKGSHTLGKPSRNYGQYDQETMFMPPGYQSLQYGDAKALPNTHSRRDVQHSNKLRLSKASLQALEYSLKNEKAHKSPFKKNTHLQEPDEENVFNLVGPNNEQEIKSRESFYGLQGKLQPHGPPGRHPDEQRDHYYTPAPARGVTMQDRYNQINDGVIQMQRQKYNKSTLDRHGRMQYDLPEVAPRLERNLGREAQNHGMQLMQSYSQDQITPYIEQRKESNQSSKYRPLRLAPSEERLYDPAQMAKKSKNNRNFVKENLNHVVFVQNKEAKKMKKERIQSEMKENMRSLDVNKNFAKVPDYIKQYHQDKEEQRTNLIIQEEIEKIPYGHRLVPERERIDTLRNLEDAQNEVITALERLPIMSHAIKRSPQLESQRINMEQKLIKIKNAIETFRRPPVYLSVN